MGRPSPLSAIDGDDYLSALRMGTYPPKYWCVLDFPVVVDPAGGRLALLEKTPVWGDAYYRKTRNEARDLLAVPGS